MRRYELPEWLDELLPDVKAPVEIFLDGDMLTARYPDGSFKPLSEDIEKAYDMVHGDGTDLVYADEVYDKFCPRDEGDVTRFRMMMVPSSDGYLLRSLDSMTDQTRLDLLEWGWKDAQKAYQEWLDDQADFFKSYRMIDTHPAFWTRGFSCSPADEKWTDDMLWDWQTSEYCQKLAPLPAHDEEGRLYISLEGGAHVADSISTWQDGYCDKARVKGVFQEHCYDELLDAFGDTYESAIVEFAHNVDKFFNPDGTAREDVEREETPLGKIIRERVAKIEEVTGDSERKWRESLPVVKFADYREWSETQQSLHEGRS